MAMFVEDFIIDAYDIQLREEVGNIGVVHMSRFYLCLGCSCVLALFHFSRIKEGENRPGWVRSVLQGCGSLVCCLHVVQPWPGGAHEAQETSWHFKKALRRV